MKIDDLCKKKGIKERKICERKCGLGVSEILSIQVWFNLSDCKDLKAFYTGVNGEFLRPFFRKCPAIFVFLKQIRKHAKTFHSIARMPVLRNLFHRFHAIASLQKRVSLDGQNIQKYGKGHIHRHRGVFVLLHEKYSLCGGTKFYHRGMLKIANGWQLGLRRITKMSASAYASRNCTNC